MTERDSAFVFRSKNTLSCAIPCINCRRDIPAETIHLCEAFTVDRRIVEEASIGGFCHCGGFFRGSDHCQCCGCEQHENTCSHICTSGDLSGCSITHDFRGRTI